VRQNAREMVALSERYGLFQLRDARVLGALADAAETATEGAVGELRGAIDAYRESGFVVFLPFYLGRLAEVTLRSGAASDAAELLAEALDLARRGGERFFEAELVRLSGDAEGTDGRREDQLERYREALAIAEQQGARWLELRAALSMASSVGGEAERQRLAAVLHALDGGGGTTDVVVATALLEETD